MSKNLNTYLTEIEQLDSAEKKYAKTHEILDQLPKDETDISYHILSKVFQLKDIDPEVKFHLLDKKLSLLLTSGYTKYFEIFYPLYHQMIVQFPECISFKINLARFKIIALFDLGKKQAAIDLGEEIIAEFKDQQEKITEEKLIEIYRITGGLHTANGNYTKCFEYLETALSISKKLNLKRKQLRLLSTLGDIFRNNFDAEKGIPYLEEGLRLEKEIGETVQRIGLLRNLALCHIQLENTEKALECLLEAKELCAEVKDERSQYTVSLTLTEVYIKTNQSDKFIESKELIEGSEFFKTNEVSQSDAYIIFSEGFLQQGDYEKALHYCDLYETSKLKLNGFIDLHNAYETKIEIYKAIEDFENAAAYYEKIIELRQKILNDKSKVAFQEFESKFQNERKEKEIQQLKLESLNYQLQSLRTQMNPAFVYQTIDSISENLHQKNITESKDSLISFARLMRAKLSFADEGLITLEDEIQFLKDYLQLENIQMANGLEVDLDIAPDLDIDFIELPSMLIQPYIEDAINNSLKNLSHKAKLLIEFKEDEEETLLCYITDNGTPRKERKHKSKIELLDEKGVALDLSSKVQIAYQTLASEKKHTGTKVSIQYAF